MGFFSWKTQDTDRSICNVHQRYYKPFRVIMTDDKGNRFVEDNYDGYGVFGGKDYYELLAEMNGYTVADLNHRATPTDKVFTELREIGISLQYPFHDDFKPKCGGSIIYPSLK